MAPLASGLCKVANAYRRYVDLIPQHINRGGKKAQALPDIFEINMEDVFGDDVSEEKAEGREDGDGAGAGDKGHGDRGR